MYKINEEKMFFDFADGLAIVINTSTGMYYGTGLLGSAILGALAEGISPAEIAAKVRENDGCPADFEEKLDAFIAELTAKEILVSGEGSGKEAAFDPAVFEEGFELSVDEFAELQDLLTADPIHDVDAEMGWPVLGDQN